jgi:hypothetical protein
MATMVRTREAQRPVYREAPGGVAARRELIARIQARQPEGTYQTAAPGTGAFGRDGKRYIPPLDPGPRPPQDLGEWVDDRVDAVLGSRTGLNEAEFAWATIAEACRTGDPKEVRAAVREAARVLPAGDASWRVFGALVEFKGKAPAFALGVAAAAVAEAQALGWDVPPRRRRRAAD